MMNNEPKAMQEIHEIRLKNYEETKDMTPAQRSERRRNETKDIIEKYGFKVISKFKS